MENELIKMAKSGDKDAFASLYTAYKDKLYRYAYFKLNDPDDAMDAVLLRLKAKKLFRSGYSRYSIVSVVLSSKRGLLTREI